MTHAQTPVSPERRVVAVMFPDLVPALARVPGHAKAPDAAAALLAALPDVRTSD